jgi:hypothetical protein
MNNETLAELQTRIHRVERQNRILMVLFCICAGFASLGAANHKSKVVHADEVITRRLTIVDAQGRTVEWKEGRNNSLFSD